ncbi:MAG: hypothetical protein C0502_01245 [Opitutus sp.]|nr:hypothetical protein [Opitutus sp.]
MMVATLSAAKTRATGIGTDANIGAQPLGSFSDADLAPVTGLPSPDSAIGEDGSEGGRLYAATLPGAEDAADLGA